MSGSRIKQKDWVLTKEVFDKFLYWLDPDQERAGERYNRIHHKLCVFFAARGCTDVEDLADETVNRMARQIDEGKNITVKPETYARAIAKYLVKEYYDKPDRKKTPLDDMAINELFKLDSRKNEFGDEDKEKLIERLEQCLQKLDPGDREVVRRYFEGSRQGEAKRNREKLARELGIKKTKLTKQIMNIKNGLKACADGDVEPPGAE
jgi:RNA polymerase sigma factor (sigma-70 family)